MNAQQALIDMIRRYGCGEDMTTITDIDVALTSLLQSAETADEIAGFTFYGVTTRRALIREQAAHIERLQSQTPMPNDRAYQRARIA